MGSLSLTTTSYPRAHWFYFHHTTVVILRDNLQALVMTSDTKEICDSQTNHNQRTRFIEEYSKNPTDVKEYKERKQLKSHLFLISILVYLLLIPIGVFDVLYNLPETILKPITWTFLAVVISVMTYYYYCARRLRLSELDNELVAYHEFASAINNNQQGKNPNLIWNHLSVAKDYLAEADLNRTSVQQRDEIIGYINALETAADRSRAINTTFPSFQNYLVGAIDISESSPIDRLINDINQKPTSDIELIKRIKSDGRRITKNLVTGFWLAILVAILGVFFILQFTDHPGASGAWATIVLGGYGLYRRQND